MLFCWREKKKSSSSHLCASKITTRNKRTPIDDAAALLFLLTSEHGDGITGQIRCAHKQTNKPLACCVFLISFSSSFVAICFLLLFLVSFLMPLFDLQFSALQASDLLCLIYKYSAFASKRFFSVDWIFFSVLIYNLLHYKQVVFLCLTYNILHL